MPELVVITDDDGDDLVLDVGPGIVGIVANEPGVVLRGEKLDALRELLDRAAMPGQAVRRPCCDHCDNRDGPGGHDYTLDGPHDGPCKECAAEQSRREHDEGTS